MRVVKKIQEAAKKAAGWSEKRNKDGTRTVGNVTFDVFGRGNKTPEQKQAMKQSWKRHWKKNPHAAELYSIDEASKEKLLNYIGKAVQSYGHAREGQHFVRKPGDFAKAAKQGVKRFVGISQAANKVAGKNTRVKATNEAFAKCPPTTTGAQGSDYGTSKKKAGVAFKKAPKVTKGAQGSDYGTPRKMTNEEVDIAVRSFYAKHYAKNYNRFLRKNPPGQSIKKSQHSAYAHVGNKYGSEIQRQLKQFHAGNELRENTILEMSDGKIRRYIGKALGDTKRKRTKSINLAADKIEKKAKVPATLEEARNKPIPDHPYHLKTDAELKYIQKDAHEAAQNMKGHDSKAEEKYLDQVNDASTVLYYRKQHNKGKDEPKKLDEAMKLIKAHEQGGHVAKVYHDKEWGEYRVKAFPKDGSHREQEDYHTDSVEDAHNTAQHMLQQMNGDGGFKKKRLDEGKVISGHSTEGGNKYELVDNGSWHSIRKTHQNGESVQNDSGGYPTLHVGTPKYIAKKWQALKASKSYTIKPFEKKDDLTEARFKIIKARIRGGKIQRRKKVATQPGWTLRGGKLKRMSASERRRRKLGQRRGKIKRRAKLSRTLVKRKRSLVKRQRLHLK